MDREPTGWKRALPLLPIAVVLAALGIAVVTNQAANESEGPPPTAIARADDLGPTDSAPPSTFTPAAPAASESAGEPAAGTAAGRVDHTLPLQVGQCFNGEPAVSEIELTACTNLHVSEVYFAFDAEDFRSTEWMDEPANFVGLRVCRDRLEELFPNRAASGALFGWDSAADLDDANGSDDRRVCWLSTGSGEPVNGSIFDSPGTG